MMSVLKFKKLSSIAITPSLETQHAAGFDISSPVDITVPPHGKVLINTQLRFELPPGTYGQICSRNSLAIFHSISVVGGTYIKY